MRVEEKVREILLEILDVKEKDIVPQASLIDDLGATSIDLVEIRTALENTFDIKIEDAGALKFKTIQDIIEFLKAAFEQKGE